VRADHSIEPTVFTSTYAYNDGTSSDRDSLRTFKDLKISQFSSLSAEEKGGVRSFIDVHGWPQAWADLRNLKAVLDSTAMPTSWNKHDTDLVVALRSVYHLTWEELSDCVFLDRRQDECEERYHDITNPGRPYVTDFPTKRFIASTFYWSDEDLLKVGEGKAMNLPLQQIALSLARPGATSERVRCIYSHRRKSIDRLMKDKARM